MESFNESIIEYKKQMEKGIIQKAYRGIMDYVMQLRTYFLNNYPEYMVGNLYYGYMDMTYFPISVKKLKDRKLKIAIVFLHDKCQFEAWLSGSNRKVQKKYSEIISDYDWNKYRIDPKNADSIIECTLDANPDFSNTIVLTKKIEESTISFIKDIELFFSQHKK